MPFFMDHDHYAAIASLLLAGDVQARAIRNVSHSVVEVKLGDGREVVWGNTVWLGSGLGGTSWQFTILDDGWPSAWTTDLRMEALPEEVATLIATYDYPAPERTKAPVDQAPAIATYVEPDPEPADDEVGC